MNQTVTKFTYTKRISDPKHLKTIKLLMEETGMNRNDCIWAVLAKGLTKEWNRLKEAISVDNAVRERI